MIDPLLQDNQTEKSQTNDKFSDILTILSSIFHLFFTCFFACMWYYNIETVLTQLSWLKDNFCSGVL